MQSVGAALDQPDFGQDHFSMFTAGEPLWDLALDTRVPLPLRLCLAFTLDQAACPVELIAELSDAAQRVSEITADTRYVNHWAATAADLKAHKPLAKQIGVGLSCTSVSNPWESWEGSPEPFDMHAYVNKCAPSAFE